VQWHWDRTPKLKFLLRFDENVEYKRPTGAYPLCDFTKFAAFVPRFRMRQLLKFHWICSRGYGVMGLLSWRGLVIPKFSASPSGETVRQTPSFRGARTCWRSSITTTSLVGLEFHPPPGRPKTLSFLSACLSVCHAFERQRLCSQFRHEGVEYRNAFDAVG